MGVRMIILVGMGVLGAAAGWGLRMLSLPSETETRSGPPPPEESVNYAVQARPVGPLLEQASVPTLEDLRDAGSSDRLRVLVRYLREADFEDVCVLLGSEFDDLRRTESAVEKLILMRAVTLDGTGIVDWIKNQAQMNSYARRQLLWRVFGAWMRHDPESALKASEKEDDELRQSMIAKYGKHDLERAIEMMRERWPGSYQLSDLERQRMRELAKVGFEVATEAAMEIESKARRESALHQILNDWVKEAPGAAWEWLVRKQGALPAWKHLANTAISSLATTDPAAALERVGDLSGYMRQSLESTIVEKWAERDLDSALSWVLGQQDPARRNTFFARLSRKLASEDPRRLLTLVHDQRIPVWTSYSGTIETKNGSSTGFGSTLGGNVIEAVQKAAIKLAERNPMSALTLLFRLTEGDGSLFGTTADRVGALWAARNPSKAVDWAAALPESPFKSELLRGVFRRWAADAPEAVAAHLSGVELDSSNLRLATTVAQGWAAKDSAAALDWSARIGAQILVETIKTVAASDVGLAIEALDRLEEADDLRRGISGVADILTKSDPEAAFAWLDQQSVGGLSNVFGNVARAWVQIEPERASQAILDMPEGRERDHAVDGMISVLVYAQKNDLEAAERWVEMIGDDKLRNKWKPRIERERRDE